MEIIKSLRKPDKKSKRLNIKISEVEEREIRELAKKYADGNVNGWVRHAALHYRPSKKDLK